MATQENHGFDLDHRMSDETKAFVVGALKVAKPSVVIGMDPKLTRSLREKNADNLLNQVQHKFTDLDIKNISIKNKNDGYEIPVTVIKPNQVKEDSPITIFFHGGGWTFGSAKTHFYSVASIASKLKTVWLSVDYRLAPEFKFDTQIEDCKSIVEYVVKNKAEFGSEKSKVGVSGEYYI